MWLRRPLGNPAGGVLAGDNGRMQSLPLFPLGTVLLPTGRLPLQIPLIVSAVKIARNA